jgi:predicted TIM-barrel fold metal-dependent hydrolase
MDRAIVVSADGHAAMPVECWPVYLEREYHGYLPELRAQQEVAQRALWLLNDLVLSPEALEVSDRDHVYRDEGWRGLWDLDVRLSEMDREGVAAEFVFYGDFRVTDPFFNVMNAPYAPEVVDAGSRAYNRWAHDTFGEAAGRLLLSGATGAGVDRDALLAEVAWLAEHGFVGTYAPGFLGLPGLPPLSDPTWDPVWSLYAETGLVLVVHGGYGLDQGLAYGLIDEATRRVAAAGGSDQELTVELQSGLFNSDFFTDLHCRQAMWQLMLGGVFDRHPGLKLMMTEVRADWIPATLGHLDALYASHRSEFAATRPPSEYWHSNCRAGLSFMHQAEVAQRHELGVDTICFGRDYPHTESTWPNTTDYWRLLFAGVPADEVRMMLGGNAIDFLGLDAAALDRIGAAIGPDLDDLTRPDAAASVDPALVDQLSRRCGILKPAEGPARLDTVDEMLRREWTTVG